MKSEMEQKTCKQDKVEMTLEEAADLFHKSYPALEPNSCSRNVGNKFQREMRFLPYTLSELTKYIIYGNLKGDYSSGEVYSIRKKKDKIEVSSHKIQEIEDKKDKRILLIDYLYRNKKESLFTPSFAIYDNPNITPDNCIKSLIHSWNSSDNGKKLFELSEDGRATLEEISKFPIWNAQEDYKKFLKFIYGEKNLSFSWRIRIVDSEQINKYNGLFTTCLSTDKEYKFLLGKSLVGMDDNLIGKKREWPKPLFQRIDSEKSSQLILIGNINIQKKHNSLESYLIKEYVQPKNIGNGVIVMNEDRIPKYLKRTLGL